MYCVSLVLQNACYRLDVRPLDAHCSCMVCARYTRSFMYFLAAKDLCSATSLLSYHNAAFMAQLTRRDTQHCARAPCSVLASHGARCSRHRSQMRQSIVDGTFPDWVRRVVHRLSGGEAQVEPWVRDALHAAGIAGDTLPLPRAAGDRHRPRPRHRDDRIFARSVTTGRGCACANGFGMTRPGASQEKVRAAGMGSRAMTAAS